MALESLYKSSTYFFTLFSFVLYIYCGVTNYAGESVSALSFLPGAKIMVIRGHDRGLNREYISGIIANSVIMWVHII